jgi:hypothetical protein
MTKGKGLTVYPSSENKKRLEEMSDEINIPQTTLINLALISMLENYEQKGSFIFVDLLNPEHKKKDR